MRSVASITRASRAQRVDKQLQVERALLRATEQLLDSGLSFTELSVEQLSRQAGIARSTFYIYFADKGALVQRLAARVTEELMAACNGWWRIADTARPEDLADAMLDVLDVYDRHRSVMRALVETSSYDADDQRCSKRTRAAPPTSVTARSFATTFMGRLNMRARSAIQRLRSSRAMRAPERRTPWNFCA